MNLDEIARCDVGRLNLICAQGLPGAYDDLNLELQTLDRWSDAVRKMTNLHMHRFREHPEKFRPFCDPQPTHLRGAALPET